MGDAREGVTPTGNCQQQSERPLFQRKRRVIRRIKVYGRETGNGTEEGKGGTKKRKKFNNSYREVENGEEMDGRNKRLGRERVMAQYVPTEII